MPPPPVPPLPPYPQVVNNCPVFPGPEDSRGTSLMAIKPEGDDLVLCPQGTVRNPSAGCLGPPPPRGCAFSWLVAEQTLSSLANRAIPS